MSDQQELDPSIYQYDQVYQQIKNPKKATQKEQINNKNFNNKQQRQRSRQKDQKYKPSSGGSKYIKKMKQVVAQRQRAHEKAYANKLQRENQKLGISKQQVFVTQSYLKKKRQQKQKQKKQKQKQKYDQQHSIANKNKTVYDFTRKLLDDSGRFRDKR